MEALLNRLVDALAEQSLLVCVVFLLAALASRMLRTASAHWRYLMWLMVIAKCLTPPIVNLSLPVASLPPTIAGSASDDVKAATASSYQAPPLKSDEALSQATPVVTQRRDTAKTPAAEALSPIRDSTRAVDVRAWLAAAWAIGFFSFSAFAVSRIWRTRQQLRRTRSAVDSETQELVAELSKQLGMRKAPLVYTTAAAGQPFVWGWLAGSIYLPPQFARMGDATQRRTVLMHELAHVSRRDAAMNLVQLFVQAIFFFHPLVWRANREIRKEREKCCDEIVLSSSLTSPRAYCEAIIEVMAHSVRGVHSAPALAVAGELEAVEERMAAILIPQRRFARRASWLARGAALAAACCVLPTALVVTSRAQDPTNAPTAAGTGSDSWQKGQVLEVRLVDAQTEQPLQGVALELQNAGEGIDFQDVKEFTTDVEGRALLPLTDLPPTAVRVYPTKAGYVPLRVYWEGAPWAKLPASITIPLPRGKKFGGVVKNESGEPAPGVTVQIDYWAKGEGKAPHIRANINAKVTTDEQGRWQIDKMPAEIDESELRIFYSHPDYVSDWTRPGFLPMPIYPPTSLQDFFDQTAVTTMRTGSDVSGRVVDENGAPIGGAAVNVDEQYWWHKLPPRTTTDENGEFRITGVDFGEQARLARPGQKPLYVTVQAAGYAPELIGVEKGGAIPTVTLQRGQRVGGRIVDEAGKPLEGVSVMERRWRDQQNRLGLGMKSNADGSFEIADLPADEIQYDFSKDGYMSIDGLAITPSEKEIVVTLKPPLKISGAVVDAETNEPINEFALVKGIDFDDGRAPFWQRSMTEQVAGGRYVADFNQEGFLWRLRVEAEGYLPDESRIFRPYDPDKGAIVCNFKLHKAKPLSGRVLGLKGEPLAEAEVYLATQSLNVDDRKVGYHNDNRMTKTDESGQFTFPAEVEPFCLVAIHEDGIAMTTEKEFAQSANLELKPWTADNEQLQIIRRPAPGQHVNFPPLQGKP